MDLALLAIAGVVTVVVVAAFAKQLGVASPLILVVVGIGYSFLTEKPFPEIPPEWILMGVLPALLYAAAVQVPLVDFRRNLRAIGGLSIGLVVITAFGTGFLLYAILPDLDLGAAIALGAVISPTDAVAATSIGKKLGMPPRLVTVLEGESLVNDASALVLLRSAIAATGLASQFNFGAALGTFAYSAALAIVVGLVIGFLSVRVRAKLKDPMLSTAISFVVPFAAYIPAEHFGASGVLAVVVAGIYAGHNGARYFDAPSRISDRLNWRTVQFVLENGVFLIMGLQLRKIVENVNDDPGNLPLWPAIALGLLVTAAVIVLHHPRPDSNLRKQCCARGIAKGASRAALRTAKQRSGTPES
jgi:NhaP-type Na+/H+ or K+/H+ antiporter